MATQEFLSDVSSGFLSAEAIRYRVKTGVSMDGWMKRGYSCNSVRTDDKHHLRHLTNIGLDTPPCPKSLPAAHSAVASCLTFVPPDPCENWEALQVAWDKACCRNPTPLFFICVSLLFSFYSLWLQRGGCGRYGGLHRVSKVFPKVWPDDMDSQLPSRLQTLVSKRKPEPAPNNSTYISKGYATFFNQFSLPSVDVTQILNQTLQHHDVETINLDCGSGLLTLRTQLRILLIGKPKIIKPFSGLRTSINE
uniref:Uncharacterized protein n=1 Tax=Aspergillus terreus TaxID=33178 RepID=Q9Y7D6_ASPTE|nr:unknown [Aspergillus terreus]